MIRCPRCERPVPLDKAGRYVPHPIRPDNPARCGASGFRPKAIRAMAKAVPS